MAIIWVSLVLPLMFLFFSSPYKEVKRRNADKVACLLWTEINKTGLLGKLEVIPNEPRDGSILIKGNLDSKEKLKQLEDLIDKLQVSEPIILRVRIKSNQPCVP